VSKKCFGKHKCRKGWRGEIRIKNLRENLRGKKVRVRRRGIEGRKIIQYLKV